VQLALVEVPKDGRTYKLRAIRRDHFIKQRAVELARRGGKARRAQMTADQWREFSAKGRAARAEKIARQKQMIALGKIGGSRTQAQRRARVAEAAELSTEI
jgi:hypothetical protein